MPLFFIEMGQGIVANGDLRVCTSPIYSCTLIAGYNARSGYGGAYHYPAETLSQADVRADMDVWAAVLRPTAVTLVFAQDTVGNGILGTKLADRNALQAWVLHQCVVPPTLTLAVRAGMELLAGGGYAAGSVRNLAGDFDMGATINVDTRTAGTYLDYGRFTLVGQNRER